MKAYKIMCDTSLAYVGQTEQELQERLAGHVREALIGTNKKCVELRKAIERGDQITIELIENMEGTGHDEGYWVDLLDPPWNSKGGDSPPSTPSQRKAIRAWVAKHKRRKFTPDPNHKMGGCTQEDYQKALLLYNTNRAEFERILQERRKPS